MKTKTIPFDLETAKKIQAGEIEGRIVTSKLNNQVRILCDDLVAKLHPDFRMMCAILRNGEEYVLCFRLDGTTTNTDEGKLVIELPEEAPEHKFKPFDKVLVRDHDYGEWNADFYSHFSEWKYICVSFGWNQCIPYEGNQELVGTTKTPKDYGDK